jgi:hypothetical protein
VEAAITMRLDRVCAAGPDVMGKQIKKQNIRNVNCRLTSTNMSVSTRVRSGFSTRQQRPLALFVSFTPGFSQVLADSKLAGNRLNGFQSSRSISHLAKARCE